MLEKIRNVRKGIILGFFLCICSIFAACGNKSVSRYDGTVNLFDNSIETYLETIGCEVSFQELSVEDTWQFEDYYRAFKSTYPECDSVIANGVVKTLCNNMGLCDVDLMQKEEIQEAICEENIYYVDFTAPILNEGFLSSEQADLGKRLAESFCSFYFSLKGLEDILKLDSLYSDTLVDYKNLWLDENEVGIDYEPSAPLNLKVSSAAYFDEFPFYYESDSYSLFFSKKDYDQLGYQEYLGGYYDFYYLIEEDLCKARMAFWKCQDITTDPAVIYTYFSKEETYWGAQYNYAANEIYLYNSWLEVKLDLVHEYIHYLDRYFIRQGTAVVGELDAYRFYKVSLFEAYTYQCQFYECDSELMKSIFTIFAPPENWEKTYDENGNADMRKFMASYSLSFLIDRDRDAEIFSAAGYKHIVKEDVVPWDYLPGYVDGCFYQFLIDKYGEEKIHELSMDAEKFVKFIVEEDYDTLFYEWVDCMMEEIDYIPQSAIEQQ